MAVVWMRGSLSEEAERAAAARHFPVADYMSTLPFGSTVVARYSVLPFYQDVVAELSYRDCKLLNTYAQHRFAADARRYAEVLAGDTPEVWTLEQALAGPDMAFVVKGETNSRKHLWDTHMFAPNKDALRTVYLRLLDDSLIGGQNLVVRPYVSLAPVSSVALRSVHGLPVSKEVRIFFLHGRELARGFYWSEHVDDRGRIGVDAIHRREIEDEVPEEWLDAILTQLGSHIPFGVVDVAQTKEGRWVVIEVNDGQQSGLSCIDPDELYGNLARALDSKERDGLVKLFGSLERNEARDPEDPEPFI